MRRQKARETALLLLYRMDMGGLTLEDAIECVEKKPDGDIWQFALELAEAVTAHRSEIDQALEAHSPEWRVERMTSTDRSLLRLVTGELLFLRDTPRAVLVDQALKLAEKFGGLESTHFVHGVLGAIMRDEHEDRPDSY
jgi:N utilization substance protein B